MTQPYTQHAWASAEVISAAKLNNIETGVGILQDFSIPLTATPTYSGRRITQIVWGSCKIVINWDTTKPMRISTIQFYAAPTLTLYATYTPTYAGRSVSVWTRT